MAPTQRDIFAAIDENSKSNSQNDGEQQNHNYAALTPTERDIFAAIDEKSKSNSQNVLALFDLDDESTEAPTDYSDDNANKNVTRKRHISQLDLRSQILTTNNSIQPTQLAISDEENEEYGFTIDDGKRRKKRKLSRFLSFPC